MRTGLGILVALLLATPASAGGRTLAGHNEIVVGPGAGWFDVHLERNETLFDPWNDTEWRWTFTGPRDQLVVIRAFDNLGTDDQPLETSFYPGGGGGGSYSGVLPAGDYRFFVASPHETATITLDVPGLEGAQRFSVESTLTTVARPIPLLEAREDGTRVYGGAAYLPEAGRMLIHYDGRPGSNSWLETSDTCWPAGRAEQPGTADFAPGCADSGGEQWCSCGSIGMTRVPAGWSGYGGWIRSLYGPPHERRDRALWLSLGPPMTDPVWPEEPAAAAPEPSQADERATAAPKRKTKHRKKKKNRRTRRRG